MLNIDGPIKGIFRWLVLAINAAAVGKIYTSYGIDWSINTSVLELLIYFAKNMSVPIFFAFLLVIKPLGKWLISKIAEQVLEKVK